VPSVAAILPEAAITYGLFDLLKRMYVRASGRSEAGIVPSLTAGVLAAFIGQVVAYPLETISRRMQVSAASAGSSGAALRAIVAEGGAGALFRGVGAASVRVVPMAVVSFGTYEFVRLQYTKVEEYVELLAARNAQVHLPSAVQEFCV
jgi:solute carrier family 25 (mitochondrial phosphate transporter), member 23/24/25/41